MVTQHKNKRQALHRGKQGLLMCQSFLIFANNRGIKIMLLRGVCFCQRLVIDNSRLPMLNRAFKSGSHRGTRTFLFSFIYHKQSLTDFSGTKCEGEFIFIYLFCCYLSFVGWAPFCQLFLQNQGQAHYACKSEVEFSSTQKNNEPSTTSS